jgi:FkbM family methyltransferase
MNPFAMAVRGLILKAGIDRLLPPFTNGQRPRSLIARFAPLNRQYASPSLRYVHRDGINYELDLSDFMEWFLYFGLQVEPRESLLDLAQEGAIVIDVGANIGEVAMKLAARAGARGRVFAFEPSPVVCAKLRKNLALNEFRNIEVLPLGLGSEPGSFRLATPTESNRGGLRISSSGEEIQVITLDQFMGQKQLTRLDLIKIDVEGFEMHVLRGAKALLERLGPVLFIELNDQNLREQGASAEELLLFLEGLSYGATNAKTGAPITSATDFSELHCDILCRKQGRAPL